MTGNPPARRRLLGTALREYRESLGYRLEEAAMILECDHSIELFSRVQSEAKDLVTSDDRQGLEQVRNKSAAALEATEKRSGNDAYDYGCDYGALTVHVRDALDIAEVWLGLGR